MRYQLRYPIARRDELEKAEAWLGKNASARWGVRFGGLMLARDRVHQRRVETISLIASFEDNADRKRFAQEFLYTTLPGAAPDTISLDSTEPPDAGFAPPLPPAPPVIEAAVVEATRPARPDDKPAMPPAGGKLFDFKA
ncbi:MAG: hypothetical protein KJ904_12030 [Alphaproteobacteria bacterium]|nr:hypothetical protein [Alphaproteobacteria bacterium]MBU0797077.1 hypothetical protein [Alphaproteobacteria bacterium]MBU0887884.1 hypothetical protein [Alphaproteobacteria bacterium]MBU1814893.1 hypothetical protein [Alphaproteobacteria bacterium]